MTSARSPVHAVSDEVGRLARLQMLAVMDTEPEPIFESLARLASLICETPTLARLDQSPPPGTRRRRRRRGPWH